MAFFLRQVNNVLNQLDDRVGTVAEEARILGSQESEDDSSNDGGDDIENDNTPCAEELDAFDDNIDFVEDYSDEEGENEGLISDGPASEIQQDVRNGVHNIDNKITASEVDHFADIALVEIQPDVTQVTVEASNSGEISAAGRDERDVDALNHSEKEGQSPMMEGHSDDSHQKNIEKLSTNDTQSQVHAVAKAIAPIATPYQVAPSFAVSNQNLIDEQNEMIQKLKDAMSKSNSEVSRMKKINTSLEHRIDISQADVVKIQKRCNTLEQKLNAAEREIQAHLTELEQAGNMMEQERKDFKLEREEMLEDQEEEIQKCKEEYKQRILEQRENYENEILSLQERLTQEERSRNYEQDEISVELENALSREKDTLQKLIDLHGEKSQLESAVTKMELQQDDLQKQVFVLSESAQVALQAQSEAESKLDTMMNSHKRQIQQRQLRESELERMVADLGTALTVAQQEAANAISTTILNQKESLDTDDASTLLALQQSHDVVLEELESTKLRLSITTSQFTAVQKELDEVTKDRVKESTIVQNKINAYEEKLQKLSDINQQLEIKIRDLGINSGGTTHDESNHNTARIRGLTNDMEQARRKITSLSDQLIRQQGISEQIKSEVISLKGRLQAATARADVAERQLTDGGSIGDNMSELESGRYSRQSTTTRRLKGGKNRFNQLPTRSMRKAIGLRQTALPGWQQQVGKTIDSMDAWMIETGGILRHEPLMRFAFAMYLCVIHLWCFVLVTFHTVEAERHDLSHIKGPLLNVASKVH